MTRVLVVHHDIDVADIEVEELRRAGYEVDQCAGPTGGGNCPVLHGEPCWQVELADVLVYDMWATGDGRPELIEDLGALHPDKPVVLTSAGSLALDWVESELNVPATVLGAPTRTEFVAAVEAALSTGAGPQTQGHRLPSHRPQFSHAPRW